MDGLEHDEAPRRDTSLEKLSRLPPVMDPEGTTTVGNAPGVNDGASALVVASEDYAQRRGLEPLVRSSSTDTRRTTFPFSPGRRRSPARRRSTAPASRSGT